MKIRKINLKSIRYIDNNNFRVFDKDNILYMVNNKIYTFYNKDINIKFMLLCGITCGCQRIIKDKKVKLYYNGIEATEEQITFIKKRGRALTYSSNYKGFDCGCKKKKST